MQKLNENEKKLLKFILKQYKNALIDKKYGNIENVNIWIYCTRELETVNKIEEKLKL